MRSAIRTALLVLVLATAFVAAYGAYWSWRAIDDGRRTVTMTDGNPKNAPQIAIANGCAGCHRIPGIPGAHGLVGPPLTGLADRVYIAGGLANTPDNLIRWIRDARGINPHTAMPSTHISEQDARDLASYLYTVR